MSLSLAASILGLLASANAHQACSLTKETHTPLSWSKCSAGGSCTTVDGAVTVDANWRWTHQVSSSTNCYTGNKWDSSICSTNADCASACCRGGAGGAGAGGAAAGGGAGGRRGGARGPGGGGGGARGY